MSVILAYIRDLISSVTSRVEYKSQNCKGSSSTFAAGHIIRRFFFFFVTLKLITKGRNYEYFIQGNGHFRKCYRFNNSLYTTSKRSAYNILVLIKPKLT